MIQEIITCDFCKKVIDPKDYHSHIAVDLHYWHGGSMGGTEDDDEYRLDLCGDCSRRLSEIIKQQLEKGGK